MDITHLTQMANRIGQFFESMPDQEEASKEIANHLRKFWEPRMRRELLAHLDATGGEGLRPIVKNAVIAHRQQLEPVTQPPALDQPLATLGLMPYRAPEVSVVTQSQVDALREAEGL